MNFIYSNQAILQWIYDEFIPGSNDSTESDNICFGNVSIGKASGVNNG